MRLSLADVKKRVARRAGAVYLVPTLLRRDELLSEIAALIALHESWLGQERGAFPADRPAELIGDYRLARALVLVLGEFYSWEPVAWPGPAADTETRALADRGVATPGQLRLALYDYVNAAYGGYLPAAQREAALDAFAASLSIARVTCDTLLALDGDDQARLRRGANLSAAPDPVAVLVRYNQRAVEALVNNASSVEWLLPPAFAAAQGTSLGTVLKRMCFLARSMGVLYDVSFAAAEAADGTPEAAITMLPEPPQTMTPQVARVAEPTSAYAVQPAAPGLDAADRALQVSLFGPREVFGFPSQYGDRLARVCRAWLGYHQHARSAGAAVRGRRAGSHAGSGLRGTAFVELHGTAMRFTLDETLLALLEDPSAGEASPPLTLGSDPAFDSLLESRLYDEFSALARAGQSFGWSIEREPEPLLAGDTILIADFALNRGGQRIYLEVAGFWTPAYRDRKRRKLTALAGLAPLIVAAPESARAELSSLEDLLPVLWFKGHVSANALLALLRTRFDDVALRRAAVPHAEMIATVERRGMVPWEACGALLGAFGGSETALLAGDVVAATQALGRPALVAVEGVGLMTATWLEQVRHALRSWVAVPPTGDPAHAAPTDATAHTLTLDEVRQRLRGTVPGLEGAQITPAWLEGLVWAAGFAVVRASLFEPYVVAQAQPGPEPVPGAQPVPVAQPRRHARRTQHVQAMPSTRATPIPWDEPDATH